MEKKFNMSIHYKLKTTSELKDIHLSDEKIVCCDMPDESKQKYESEIGKVRVADFMVVADSLDDAKNKAVEMVQNFGDIELVKVEEKLL